MGALRSLERDCNTLFSRRPRTNHWSKIQCERGFEESRLSLNMSWRWIPCPRRRCDQILHTRRPTPANYFPSNMQRIEPTRFCGGTAQDHFGSMQVLPFLRIQLHHCLFFGLIGSAGASTSTCVELNSTGPPTFTPIPIGRP